MSREAASDAVATAAGTTVVNCTQCAVEDGTCNLPGLSQVRYGLNGRFATKTLSGAVGCNNTVFGDPYPGVDKVCEYSPATTSAPPAPTWAQCAVEGGTCAVNGTQQVRYGLNNSFVTRAVTGSVACNNQTFGDPYVGYAKVCQTTGAAAPSSPLPSDAIFAPTSFWYQPLPANIPLHPNSANFTTELIRQKNTFYGTVDFNTVNYSSPVYTAAAGTPTTAVSFYDCQNKGYADPALLAQWSAVPIPSTAQQAGGTDGEMTVYQPSTNTLWEFWQSSKTNGQWRACWGGQMKNVSTSDGTWAYPFGTTATGLPFIGGQITAEELKRGEIRHVIGISLVNPEAWNIFSWPANRSDGYNPTGAPNRIPEGLRFRLDPSINVDGLNMHPVGKIIAKAAQKYGFVVWDTAGSVNMRAQNAKSYTASGQPDPYVALFNGTPSYSILTNFPWERTQFLPMNYGKP